MKKIEIQGFKSFADKLSLEFDDGITAIVGPNGSGKSNVADAIRWVLGEQSVKTLRGSKMEDIIFAGTERRKALSFAEVSITFDNRTQLFAVDYSEVCITRRVYRSGESEYYINKSKCRLKDIHEMLMDTGIGKDGYSIIGQGQVEKLLSTKPDDRRHIFEEAAGIVKYKSRKVESEKKLESEHQNLLRVNDIITEIEGHLQPLEEQAEKTKKFLGFKEDLKLYEMNQFIYEHEELKEKMLSIDEEMNLLVDQIESSKEEQRQAKEKNRDFLDTLQDIENKWEEARQRVTHLMTELEKLDGQVKLNEERKNFLHQDIARLEQVIFESKDKKEEKVTQLTSKENDLKQVAEEMAVFEEKLVELKNATAEVENKLKHTQEQLSTHKNQGLSLTERITDKRSEHQREEIFLEQLKHQKDKLHEEKQNLHEKLSEHDQIHTELSNKNLIFRKTMDEYADKMKTYQQESKDKKQMLHQLSENYQKYINDLNTKKSRLRFLEDMHDDYEGFNKAVKNIMQLKEKTPASWRKINGVVADLINVPKNYETAIEIALGAAIQNIVTEDEQAAKEAIEYIKRNKLGRATFLPLNRVEKRRKPDGNMQRFSGYLGVASDLVKFDPKYENAISRLLGNVIIAKTFNDGAALAKEYGRFMRVVTLEGEQFNIGGSITGGSIYKRNSSILSRKREMDELKETIKKAEKKLRQKQVEIGELKESLQSSVEQFNDIEENYKTCEGQLMEITQKLQQVTYLKNYVTEKIQTIEDDAQGLDSKRDDKLSIIEVLKQEIETLQGEQSTFDDKYVAMEEGISKLREEKENLTTAHTELMLKYNTVQQTKERFDENILWLQRDIEELREQISKSVKQIEANNKEIENLDSKKDEIYQSTKDEQDNLAKTKEYLVELEQEKDALGEKQKSFTQRIESCLEKIEALQRELSRFENQRTRMEVQLDNLRDKMWEDYKLTYSTCLSHKQDLGNSQEMKSHIQKLKTAIAGLGSINMNALEEYEATKDRYEFLSTQRDDIITAEEKLRLLIDELTKAMEEQFIERFEMIAHEFNIVFRKLFGGGKGILKLSDDEDILTTGIDIIAQPPGKKLQSMMLLSGGERALTAIALLFAIQRMNPSPFCVLDEIEAALDDYNIQRFAEFLQELSVNTQFLIITHRKGTMESANALYGITMEEKGVSKPVSVKFDDPSELKLA